jgi:hypothetical protein
MPVLSTSDGQAFSVSGLTYQELRDLVFTNAGVPAGVAGQITKGTGNPPAWIEFDGRLLSTAKTVSVKQANVVQVTPD